jgi:hypothetical protein
VSFVWYYRWRRFILWTVRRIYWLAFPCGTWTLCSRDFACPLKKIEVNKIPYDRLEGVIRTMIKDLEKRKDKAMKRSDTDDFWIKIESLQWVLFVILAIKNGNMVVI